MFSLFPKRPAAGLVPRRQWLRMMAAGAGAPLLANTVLAARESTLTGSGTDAPLSHPPTARHLISIFLCGGPSQPDLWDLKPEAPVGVRSVFQPIDTTVPGIQFGSLIPRVAQHADKLAVIRSLTHDNNDHNFAIARVLLGQLPERVTEVHAARDDHPGIGAILHRVLGPVGDSPAWVVLPRPFTTYSPPYKGQSGGFLGPAWDPITLRKEAKGSLTDAAVELDAIRLPEGVDSRRLQARSALAREFETLQVPSPGTDRGQLPAPLSLQRMEAAYSEAFDLVTTSAARQAFDLDREPDRVRDRYGRNEYGQSFLLARRLIEAGVRTVNLFWTFFDTKGCQFNLWDNHGVASDVCGIDGQLTGVQQLTHEYCTPSFDRSFSALLEDLADRGLLDETLVSVAGEFGRTPQINQWNGRDHWAHCYTQLLAGGGVRGGQVYGASDRQGAWVKDNPVTPDDFAATILHAFGLAPETAVLHPTGRPVRITTGQPVTALF